MRPFLVIAALFACSGVQACPSPAKPQDGFFDRYTHIFSAVVTGVRLPRGDADVEMYVRNAALEKTERNIFIADGYAYDVQVEVTHVYKGKAPKSDWLSVEAGCKSQYRSCLIAAYLQSTQTGFWLPGTNGRQSSSTIRTSFAHSRSWTHEGASYSLSGPLRISTVSDPTHSRRRPPSSSVRSQHARSAGT